MKHKKYSIVLLVVVSCILMGFVDAIVQPGYVMKSAIKVSLFLILPFAYACFDQKCNLKRLLIPQRRGIKIALLSGVGIYILVLAAYFILKDWFDFSAVTAALDNEVGVNKENFVWIAFYISFVNSLLEEFFFRGFAFFCLKEVSSRTFAYVFSSVMFSLYHVAMLLGWFGIELIFLSILGLAIGGILFNFCNEKSGNIYISWILHMFANFAINTIGFVLFAAF